MAFLITTTQHVLAFDQSAQTFRRVHSGRGLYYGVCEVGDQYFIACRNETRGPEDERLRQLERGTILVFDRNFRLIEELEPEFPLRDVHGMASFDGKLWVTCSLDNMVAVFDLKTRAWSSWYPSPDPGARGRDVNHFNSIALIEGRVWLVAHNFGASHLLCYDYPSLELRKVHQVGHQAHDIFPLDGALATCNSQFGSLQSMAGREVRTGSFPRGIAFEQGAIVLGLSMYASRADRAQADGVLRVFRNDWQHEADYRLAQVGMILAIHPLGERSDWPSHLEVWGSWEAFKNSYNPDAPGNVYKPGSGRIDQCLTPGEWHGAEGTSRWTAALESSLAVTVNAAETSLSIAMYSGYPGQYRVRVHLNQVELGVVHFETPGPKTVTLPIPADAIGPCTLRFALPFLWRPIDVIDGSMDPRALGIAVSEIRLH